MGRPELVAATTADMFVVGLARIFVVPGVREQYLKSL
jgi:hypothetical protein